ncbi:MAG TPA: hypothetical protein PL185_03070 [Flavobacteriales bacterium]|nr:hypothetical protein [Flavobacteriales bacterium]HPH81522.1 hypothetical protein [Flavobacteriales bacterium]
MEEYNILDQPEQNANTQERPVIITVICILGFLGAAITIPLIFSELAKSVATWYPFYLAFAATIGLICMLGLWKMKKWAALLYTAFVAMNQLLLYTLGAWTLFSFIVPAVVVAIALSQLNKMS